MSRTKMFIYYIFRVISGNSLLFLSGIMVATGVNMITSDLPGSIIANNGMICFIAVLFLTLAAILTRWATLINKFNSLAVKKIELLSDKFDEKELWFEIFCDSKYQHIKNHLVRCLVCSVVLVTVIIILIIQPINLSRIFISQ